MQSILNSAHVHDVAGGLLLWHLRLKDYKGSCPALCLLAILFCACCRRSSFSAAAKSLKDAPSHETARKALYACLPDDPDLLRRRIERALGACISRPLRRHLRSRRHRLACDLTLIPYHGQHHSDADEVVRGKARVKVAVYVRYRAGRRGKKGKERLAYAFWGWQPRDVRGLHEQYRLRFGIETSYRQMNEGRAKTSTRDPQWRLLLVGLGLILRDVWVWLHHEVLSTPRRGRRLHKPERLRFKQLLKWLEHEAEEAFGCVTEVATDRPPPQQPLSSLR